MTLVIAGRRLPGALSCFNFKCWEMQVTNRVIILLELQFLINASNKGSQQYDSWGAQDLFGARQPANVDADDSSRCLASWFEIWADSSRCRVPGVQVWCSRCRGPFGLETMLLLMLMIVLGVQVSCSKCRDVIFKVPRTFLVGDDLLCTSRTQASLLWPTKCCPEFKAFSQTTS